MKHAVTQIRIVRKNARYWGVDDDKIGFLGCSGRSFGGNVVPTHFDFQWYTGFDEVDLVSARPDFLLLLYPVITMGDDFGHRVADEPVGNTSNTGRDRALLSTAACRCKFSSCFYRCRE